MLAGRSDQERDIVEHLPQLADLGRLPLDPPDREQAFDLLLGECELPQRDR